MTEVSKEYEIKTKMEQEQRLQLKMLFVLVYNEHRNRQCLNGFRFSLTSSSSGTKISKHVSIKST